MKIAFIINSLNSFRHLAPLIKGGLERGYDIECWHSYAIEKSSPKGYLFPDIGRSPFSEAQYPTLKKIPFESKADMQQAMVNRKDIPFFVSQYYPEIELDPKTIQEFSATWCTIMHVHDNFLEMKRVKMDVARNGIKKLFFSYADHFFSLGMRYFDEMLKDGRTYFADPNLEVHQIGCAMVYPELLHLDKEAIRRKYGIPNGKNILLYLPYPFNFPDAVGYKSTAAWQAAFAGMHIRKEAGKKFKDNELVVTPLHKWIPKYLSYIRKAFRNPRSREWLVNHWNEPAVVDAIRSFCDRNNLLLVVKPRIKFPFCDAAYEKADMVISDDESQFCPSKLQELFAICDVSVGYSTTAVYESIYCNVPFINLRYPEWFDMNPHRKYWNFRSDGTPFVFKDAVWDSTIPDFIRNFGSAGLEQYRMNQHQRKAYMARYTGMEFPTLADNFYAVIDQKNGSKRDS